MTFFTSKNSEAELQESSHLNQESADDCFCKPSPKICLLQRRFVKRIPRLLFYVCLPAFLLGLCEFATAQKPESPKATQLRELEKLIREVYGIGDSKTRTEKKEMLDKMVKSIESDLQNGKIDQQVFAAIKVAMVLANETSQVSSLRNLLQIAETHFEIREEGFIVNQISEYLVSCKTKDDVGLALPTLTAVALEKAEIKQFSKAKEILKAIALQSKGKNETAFKSTQSMIARIEKQAKSHELYVLALSRLEKEPDNQKANFSVGYWLAVYESKWNEANMYLVKGDQDKWKDAAYLSNSASSVTEKLSAADSWWNLCESLSNKAAEADASAAIRIHLQDVYSALQPQVTPGITKDLITSRLSKIKAALEAESVPGLSKDANSKTSSVAEGSGAIMLPIGEWSDALSMVRLPEDGVLGKWQYKDNVLSCKASSDACCRLPVVVRGNYEITCTFVRRSGSDSIGFFVPLNNGFCNILLSGWNGKASGLQFIDGKNASELDPKKTGASIRPGTITNDVVNEVRISVGQAPGYASISASINGKTSIAWQGEVSRLSPSPYMNLNCPEALGVCANMSIVDFKSFQVKVLPDQTASALGPFSRAYRMSSNWRNSLVQVNANPPSDLMSKCRIWNNKAYYISENPMSFTQAQCLAKQLDGRLLTISSDAENEFILNEGKGLWIWTSASRCSSLKNWSDERGQPLSYMGKFSQGQPSLREKETILGLQTGSRATRGWDDFNYNSLSLHACIEWGEEKTVEK